MATGTVIASDGATSNFRDYSSCEAHLFALQTSTGRIDYEFCLPGKVQLPANGAQVTVNIADVASEFCPRADISIWDQDLRILLRAVSNIDFDIGTLGTVTRSFACHQVDDGYFRGTELEVGIDGEVARVSTGANIVLGGYEISAHRTGQLVTLCPGLGSECSYPMSADVVVMQRLP